MTPPKGAPAGGGVAGEAVPPWAEELRRRYLRGESSQFVLHGNVHDVVLAGGELSGVTEYLSRVLFARSKDSVLLYNVSTGVRFVKRAAELAGLDELLLHREPAKVLPLLERALVTSDRVAVVLEYADTIAPAGETSFSTLDDRAAVVTLHRWSLLRSLERGDSVVVAVVENLADLHPALVSNPRVATVRVAMPGPDERRRVINYADPSLAPADVERLTELTAGLKATQIASILTPASAGDDDAERARFIAQLIARGAPASPAQRERAEKLAALTKGMAKDEVRRLLAPEGPPAPEPAAGGARAEVDRLVAARKREIIERECFGLIEFVEPKHGFDVVGGLDEVKRELALVAENMREGRKNRCPMGLLFTGPMGTGKTFVAEAFAKESGLTAIKLKNFRSKWVGATEGNLERILNVVQAIGQIVVIIDEGDRAFGGGGDGDGDGGTSSRVIGRIKEFMSDTQNRGRVLFIVMTNRPDKLDVDLKRAGRLDRKIPFLYPQTTDEVAHVLRAQFRKAKVAFEAAPPAGADASLADTAPHLEAAARAATARASGAPAGAGAEPPLDPALLAPLVGYSNADLESVVLLAADHAALERGHDAPLRPADLARGIADYLPSRDVRMIEYMELLAVFEASNRRMLPKKYADLSVDELQARLAVLRAECGGRR
ncbi:MAG TPA: ATP-binding protein [Polyangiaceae bacterium]|nr:ATP-binding protein [Polyangiaceae bacterium]